MITPAAPIPADQSITVRVNYTGSPGVHEDGDGSQEGWFRYSTDGSFVTTEPMGTQAWMPLNNHPGTVTKPQITGPGLAGPGFYDATGACSKQFPPVSTLSVTERKIGDIYVDPRPTLVLTATDGGTPQYNLDGAGFVTYTGPVALSNGTHTVVHRSLDDQGNQEADRTQSITVLVEPAVDGTVSGSVGPTLSLSLGGPATFAPFTAGVGQDYTASLTATVLSTAGDAALSVSAPSSNATGRLVNGTFALVNPLEARAASAGGTGGAFAPLSTTAGNPLTLLTYSAPKSSDAVTVDFQQTIGADEPLRTGSYAKPLTFTLSTTTP